MISLQNGITSDLTESSSRRTLMIVVTGFVVVVVIGGVYGFLRWREITENREALQTMRDLSVEQLIERCGAPASDEYKYELGYVDGQFRNVPTLRILKYRGGGDWIRLRFKQRGDHQWHLSFFDSPAVGVQADAENAYIAVPQFPCIIPPDRFRIPKLFQQP